MIGLRRMVTRVAERCGKAVPHFILLACSTLFSIVLAEVALRATGFGTVGVDYRAIILNDDRFGHRLRPNSMVRITGAMNDFSTVIRTDPAGFRLREPGGKVPTSNQPVILLGDSETFGQGVTEADMLDSVMEGMLGATEWAARVINLGLPGVGTLSEEAVFSHVGLGQKPGVVVLLVTPGNDLRDNISFTEPSRRSDDGSRRSILKNSRLYGLARGASLSLVMNVPTIREAAFSILPTTKDVLPQFVEQWYMGNWVETGLPLMMGALQRIQESCNKHGCHFLVAVIPSLPQFHKDYHDLMIAITPEDILHEVLTDMRRPQRLVREGCESRSIQYVELLDDFQRLSLEKGMSLKHPHDGHLNARGTKVVAELLVRQIEVHFRSLARAH